MVLIQEIEMSPHLGQFWEELPLCKLMPLLLLRRQQNSVTVSEESSCKNAKDYQGCHPVTFTFHVVCLLPNAAVSAASIQVFRLPTLTEDAPLLGSESVSGYLSQVPVRVKAERIFLMDSALLFRVHFNERIGEDMSHGRNLIASTFLT
jgi:hypothetical protein